MERSIFKEGKQMFYEPRITELHVGYIAETALLPVYEGDNGGGYAEQVLTVNDLRGIDDFDFAVRTKCLEIFKT